MCKSSKEQGIRWPNQRRKRESHIGDNLTKAAEGLTFCGGWARPELGEMKDQGVDRQDRFRLCRLENLWYNRLAPIILGRR